MSIEPNISTLINPTKRVAESEFGKNEIKAVATPAMTKANKMER
jgi:hypothetical protein